MTGCARADESIAYIALGSNLGDRERHLDAGLAALRALPGVRDVVVSRIYETDPVGPGEQRPYLNAVARVRTRLAPRVLLDRLFEIERSEGRERSGERNAPRTLDLDLILYGDLVLDETGLIVPHPRFRERRFVLEPLAEIAPAFVDPVTRRTVADLLSDLGSS